MTYIKNIWVDQDVERPKTYEVTNNQDGSITLTDSFGTVTELGTPVNATNMNHIEDGIEQCYTDLANVDLNNLSATGEARLGGNKVDRTGDTMTGSLNIEVDQYPLTLIKSDFTKGTTPEAATYFTIPFNDSTNSSTSYTDTRLGALEVAINTSGTITTNVIAYKNAVGENVRATLSASVASDGTTSTTAVTPPANSNSTNIATTKWVKDFVKTSGSNYMSTFSKAQKGYYKFTNGLIINWGETEFAKTGTEVSFATAFTSTNYQVAIGVKSTDAGNYSVGGAVMSKNTSKFKAYGYKTGGTSAMLYWIAIGY